MTVQRGLRTGLAAVAGLALSMTFPVTPANATTATVQPASPDAVAASAADRAAATGVDQLRKGAEEDFRRVGLTPGGGGLFYAAYERTYRGLPVVGGDAVVVADGAGRVRGTSAAETAAISVDTKARISAAKATEVARGQLSKVDSMVAPKLVVLAGNSPKLAYEVVVAGTKAANPSNLHVFVDGTTGAVLETRDDVKMSNFPAAAPKAAANEVGTLGAGNSYYAGNVTIDTTNSGGTYTMRDPQRTNISCARQNSSPFSGPDDNWGNGSGTDLETACVDALFGVQTEWKMLGEWLGRNGINGNGGGFPAYVGLNQANAYWNGSSTTYGRSSDSQRQATPMDVVAHEYGHAIFQTTPGGAGSGNENGGLNESTGDIFGAITEHYANNAKDTPDYDVGEGVNLVGRGPIRYMNQPSRISGNPDCYSSSIPNTEVHAAAGPQNHWFYLLAEGTAPVGKPASPTCNNTSITGIGIQKAGKIFYNGLLKKTSSWNHKAARKATLEAALALYPGSCTEFNTTKAAWDAISVTAATGEPTSCTPQGNDFSVGVTPASGSVKPGESATVTVNTATTNGTAQSVSLSASGLPAGATATFNPASVQSGASSTLTIATSASTPDGTSTITVTGTGASGARTAQYKLTVGTGGDVRTYTNDTDYALNDYGTVNSPITSTATGNAVSPVKVSVTGTHTCSEDLRISLKAPDGSTYSVKPTGSLPCTDLGTRNYSVNVTNEVAAGTWTLVVYDAYAQDTGTLSSWSITV
ncbi:M4 family metallopeptidase [Amycolatopsis roodepoortensis]|uniref:Zn-dependent metalloprotease/subtilisin-like proprotein convertase family protein n=1 Tax=Amycolatopsis roodepoortensis TaxID=700274 RepID=A0ABR9LHS4_9PSEU|nr:M4 family metallopeptidase [Amycolatopsis roodepoortensis]MBE1580235.1 Zn-dependent metalloprotease/subtilisin-like proprotein convertase family protein [Amycolatopsis roodepoortensis]